VAGAPDAEAIRARADEVRERIRAAGDRLDRVSLIAVTKGFPHELVSRALAAGLVDLGENYAQELVAKARELEQVGSADLPARQPAPRWHFIGGLQTNKVKLLTGLVALWQTVDREALVDELARRAPGARVLIQVNTTAEPQKSGCAPEQTQALVSSARERGLDVQGLMTVGPTEPGADPRPSFALLAALGQRCQVAELSMGMSGDYALAVAEGSTMVRIGSALFGDRPSRS
jgi:pyridoxal phosphate enzyme (YggS family)